MSTPTGPAWDPQAIAQPAREAASEAAREGGRLIDQAKQSAMRAAEGRKDAAADYLRALASAVDSGAKELDRQGRARSASLVSKAAEEFGGLVDRLSQPRAGDLVHELEGFARRRPALFFGAAFLADFAGTRFLKSSAPYGQTGRTGAMGQMGDGNGGQRPAAEDPFGAGPSGSLGSDPSASGAAAPVAGSEYGTGRATP